MRQFENLIVWQKAQDLAVVVYEQFSLRNDYGFQDQIRRASVSVSNNIAEGCDRQSDAEFVRFLHIAKGSCSEVRSMLYLALRLKYINENQQVQLINQTIEVSKLLLGLIKSLNPQR